MMLEIFLIVFCPIRSATSGQSVTLSAPVNFSVQSERNTRLPQPAPTPPLSECSRKRAQGLPPGVNIPEELCFDETRPVDRKERSKAKVGNSPQSATIEAIDLPFEKLPAEVQRIVKITVPEMDTAAVVFDLTIIPTADEKAKNRLVKSYSYSSSGKNKAAGKDPNRHTWLFKRQSNLLKLEFAEIDTTK